MKREKFIALQRWHRKSSGEIDRDTKRTETKSRLTLDDIKVGFKRRDKSGFDEKPVAPALERSGNLDGELLLQHKINESRIVAPYLMRIGPSHEFSISDISRVIPFVTVEIDVVRRTSFVVTALYSPSPWPSPISLWRLL